MTVIFTDQEAAATMSVLSAFMATVGQNSSITPVQRKAVANAMAALMIARLQQLNAADNEQSISA